MSILLRIVRTALTNILRHGIINLTAVFVITLLFFICNAFVFTGAAVQGALTTVNQQLDLTLNFSKSIDTLEAQPLIRELKQKFPTVRSVTFISSEDAFSGFLQNFKTVNPTLTSWLRENTGDSPLPATLIISVDPAIHAPIIDYLTNSHYAKILDLERVGASNLAIQSAQKIIGLDHLLTSTGTIAGLTFAIIAALIIMAVVRLTITTRSDEITIMRLVGATSAYVRLPFIIEGVILSGSASLLGCLIFLTAIGTVDFETLSGSLFGATGNLLDSARTTYATHFWVTTGWQTISAILLGIGASSVATWRYLKIH